MGEQKMNLGNRSDVSFDGFDVEDEVDTPANDKNQEGDKKPETKTDVEVNTDTDKGGEKDGKKNNDQGDRKGDGKGDDKEDADDEDFKDDGEEPKERQKKFNNRAAQVRIAKKEAKNNKGSGNKKDDISDDSEDDDIDDDDIEDDDDKISEKDKKVLDKYFKATGLDKKILELNNKVSSVDDEKEFDKFLNSPDNKYFAPFKDKIWRYSQTESRKNLPFETIALEVVGMQGILKMAAKMVEEANKKAINNSSGNGSGAKGSDSSKLLPGADKPIDEMTKEEFDAFITKTRQTNA